MNYIDSLSLSIFINITYKYVLIFVDCFIKMKHLVLITFMKLKKLSTAFMLMFENIMIYLSSSCLIETHNLSSMSESICVKC